MFDYAVTFWMAVDRTNVYNPYSCNEVVFVSENHNLWDMICFGEDFYFDHPEFDKLTDGEYLVYARGTAEFESDVDWESGIEEGHYLLGIDKLRIVPFSEVKDGQIHE